MRKSLLCVALTLVVCLPLSAQSNDIGLWYSTATLSDTTADGTSTNFDNGKGYGISFNHFWTGPLSTEFTATQLRSDASFDINGQRALDLGRFKFRPITANVQWHFARNAMVSPYIGAGLAYVTSDDLSSSDLDVAGIGTVKVGNKTTWNGNAGININVGHMFAVALDGKYIAYEPTSTGTGGSQKLKLNPTIVSGGVKLRF